LEQFEASLDCASLCKTPLFYMSRTVNDGPVTQDCFDPLVEKFDQPLVSVISLLTGLICLAAMIMSFPLCMGFSNSGKDMMDG